MDELLVGAHVPEPYDPAAFPDVSEMPPPDVPHYLYSLARLDLLKRGLFPVHAACVGKDGRNALLVGHSGDGKTTVAMKLLATGRWKMFSGNKTVVDFFAPGKMAAVGGTRIVSVKRPDGSRSAARLRADQAEPAPRVDVLAVFRLRLNDGYDCASKLPPLNALHVLYPFFLDVVNADVILDDGKRVVAGEPPPGARERLAKELAAALAAIPAYEITGSAAFVTGQIEKLL